MRLLLWSQWWIVIAIYRVVTEMNPGFPDSWVLQFVGGSGPRLQNILNHMIRVVGDQLLMM